MGLPCADIIAAIVCKLAPSSGTLPTARDPDSVTATSYNSPQCTASDGHWKIGQGASWQSKNMYEPKKFVDTFRIYHIGETYEPMGALFMPIHFLAKSIISWHSNCKLFPSHSRKFLHIYLHHVLPNSGWFEAQWVLSESVYTDFRRNSCTWAACRQTSPAMQRIILPRIHRIFPLSVPEFTKPAVFSGMNFRMKHRGQWLAPRLCCC